MGPVGAEKDSTDVMVTSGDVPKPAELGCMWMSMARCTSGFVGPRLMVWGKSKLSESGWPVPRIASETSSVVELIRWDSGLNVSMHDQQ